MDTWQLSQAPDSVNSALDVEDDEDWQSILRSYKGRLEELVWTEAKETDIPRAGELV